MGGKFPIRADLTADYVRSILDYDPDTGVFRWKKFGPGKRPDLIAGHTNKRNRGYVEIGIDGKAYYAHRIAWLIMTGGWPPEHIDHQKGDPSDNRWETLREATPSQNQFNRKMQINNRAGFKGIHKHHNKWVARIRAHGKETYLGLFHTKEEAAAAYNRASDYFHGEYAHFSSRTAHKKN